MRSRLFAAAALLSVSLPALATPVKYTESYAADGFFNGVPFSNQLLTLTGYGDTNDLIVSGRHGNDAYVNLSSVFITLGNQTSAATDSFRSESQSEGYTAWIAKTDNFRPNEKVRPSVFNPAIYYTNLETEESVIGQLLASSPPFDYDTVNGLIEVTAYAGGNTENATFATTFNTAATPEPSSFALLGTGLLGIAGVVRKRFA